MIKLTSCYSLTSVLKVGYTWTSHQRAVAVSFQLPLGFLTETLECPPNFSSLGGAYNDIHPWPIVSMTSMSENPLFQVPQDASRPHVRHLNAKRFPVSQPRLTQASVSLAVPSILVTKSLLLAQQECQPRRKSDRQQKSRRFQSLISSDSSQSCSSNRSRNKRAISKKNAHNIIEKRYRTNLNDKTAALRDSIPSLQSTGGESLVVKYVWSRIHIAQEHQRS
jgi:hypothetical protein